LPKSAPYFSTAAGETTMPATSASVAGKCADGDFILIEISSGPVASTLSTVATSEAQRQRFFGSMIRRKFFTTAAAS
jgi:hypothetical protein